MRVLIVGNSAAAAGCIEALGSSGAGARVTVVTAEPRAVYGRPLISYYLMGKTAQENMYYRDGDFYKKNGAKLVINTRIARIDPKAKKAYAADGREFAYDRLLIATGSSPSAPPVEGMNERNTRRFMTWEDADAVQRALRADTQAVVAGAGLIGLKCAEALCGKAAGVTVVELMDRILPAVLDAQNAALVQRLFEQNGVRFCLGRAVKRVEGETIPKSISLSDGTELPCGLFVLATGVRPNAELAEQAGVTVGRGILVDAYGRTDVPGIYAAGDATESVDAVTGERKIMAIWPNAYLQGEAAGRHMTGAQGHAPALMPMNAATFFGYPVVTAGTVGGDGAMCVSRGTANNVRKLYVRSGRVEGMAFFGDVARAGLYAALIREQTPVADPEELLSENFGINWYDKKTRLEKLR